MSSFVKRKLLVSEYPFRRSDNRGKECENVPSCEEVGSTDLELVQDCSPNDKKYPGEDVKLI